MFGLLFAAALTTVEVISAAEVVAAAATAVTAVSVAVSTVAEHCSSSSDDE